MTKYEKLYGVGVTVDHFKNEESNVKEKLRLATINYNNIYEEPYSYEQQVRLHEVNQAIQWARKILEDIDE